MVDGEPRANLRTHASPKPLSSNSRTPHQHGQNQTEVQQPTSLLRICSQNSNAIHVRDQSQSAVLASHIFYLMLLPLWPTTLWEGAALRRALRAAQGMRGVRAHFQRALMGALDTTSGGMRAVERSVELQVDRGRDLVRDR